LLVGGERSVRRGLIKKWWVDEKMGSLRGMMERRGGEGIWREV